MVLKVLAPLLLQVWGSAGSSAYLRSGGRYFRIVRSLESVRERDALVIGRARTRLPAGWDLIPVSNVPGAVGPRELPRLLNEITGSLRENPDRAVVIACPEYLALHNGFEALMKFLNTVRDYALVHGGRAYLVTERGAWDERQYALLKLLEG